jgi:diguanylate cyclase (GGDEF)-like protein
LIFGPAHREQSAGVGSAALGRKNKLDDEQLRNLVRELTEAGVESGRLTTRDGKRTKGLVFFLADLKAEEAEKILDRADLTLPLSVDALATLTNLREIVAENRTLKGLAITDTLTGLFNVRHFRERMLVEMQRVQRTGRPCSLMIIDLDRFKPVNDIHGHQVGDGILRAVGEIVKTSVRATDVPVRYGGDEFAVILPDTDIWSAYRLTERVRMYLAEDERTSRYEVTGSFGLATIGPTDRIDLESFMAKADQAMYQAKTAGGNRVWFFEKDRLLKEQVGLSRDERSFIYDQLSED